MTPQTPPKEPWYTRWYVWLIPWVMMIGLLFTSIQASPTPIPVRDFTLEEVVQILTGMALIALFLERALEVFITTWRGPGATEHENRVSKAQQLLEAAQKELENPDALTDAELEVKQTALKRAETALNEAEGRKASYKSITHRIALWTSLIFGLLISTVGARSLEPLMNADVVKSLTPFQTGALHVTDVLLTGGLIGGGSDGIHKITAVFTEFFEKTRTNIKNS